MAKTNKIIKIVLPGDCDKQELVEIIADAIKKASEIEKKNDIEQDQQERETWQEVIHYKDRSGLKPFYRCIMEFLDSLVFLLRSPFIPAKKITGTFAIHSSLQMVFDFLVSVAKLWLALISILSFYAVFVMQRFYFLIIPILAYMFWGIFHIVSAQVSKLQDSDRLISLLGILCAIMPITVRYAWNFTTALLSICQGTEINLWEVW